MQTLNMVPANVIEIVTPKKVLLNGLWFGPIKPKRAFILIHGLTGSAFSRLGIVRELTDSQTAVITFNNRGHDIVSKIRSSKESANSRLGGTAHEVFTECADDIQGVINSVRRAGVKEIYLIGHSTGCQKSIYWAHKTKGKEVKGVILLAPLSDYADVSTNPKLPKLTRIAKSLVRAKKSHQLMPMQLLDETLDAQRFLSLHSPDSIEEMFTYSQSGKRPRIYSSVKAPVLALFAEKDEYADRPAMKISDWFAEHSGSRYYEDAIIPRVGHGFKGGEKQVIQVIKQWISAI